MRLEMIIPDAKLAEVVRSKLRLGFKVRGIIIEGEDQMMIAFTRTVKRPKQEELFVDRNR